MAAENMGLLTKDSMKIQLECGHPNKNAGEYCENCGQVVPSTAKPEDAPNGYLQGVE